VHRWPKVGQEPHSRGNRHLFGIVRQAQAVGRRAWCGFGVGRHDGAGACRVRIRQGVPRRGAGTAARDRELYAIRDQAAQRHYHSIHPNSFRSIRGRTLCACVFDEVAVWRDEQSAQPDVEVYRSVLPALLTTKGMLVGISTGYRRVGLLWQKHRDHFGHDDAGTLVVQGATQQFNGTVDEAEIAAQVAADPAAARSEWFGQFRDDLSTYLSDDLIDAAIEPGRPLELSPQKGVAYRAFTDAAAGVGRGDAYTISLGHQQDDKFVVDVVRAVVGKFNPSEVTKQYAQLCREYHVHRVVGDNWAPGWVAQAWTDAGLEYQKSSLSKSQIYLEVLPLFARNVVRLPDHSKLIRELGTKHARRRP